MAIGDNLFGVWDYVVLAALLLVSSGIGIYYRFTGGKQKTVQEYLLADRNMPIIPVAFSLMASFMSAITLLGVSSENYTYGFQFIVINISYGIFTPVAAYLYLPVFFRLQATSAYEYLEKRFGSAARLAASVSYSLQMVLYMGVALYAPALALEAITGISQIFAILSVGLVCTFYSTIGGMKAVLMTDVFQSGLMFAAVFSIIIHAGMEIGLDGVWDIAAEHGRTSLLNFDPDPTTRHTWFTLIIGGGITFLSLYAVNQTQVQRYLTVRSLTAAQRALWLNWPILTLLSLSTSLAGLCIFARYAKCDPQCAKQLSSTDQLMPYYVVDTMGHIPGLAGLFVAGIFSASLSTVSASVNSLAAVTIEDYYKPIYRRLYNAPLPERAQALYSKVIALVFGLVCVAVAFLAQTLGDVLQASLTIFGVVGGPLLGLFTLGMFTTFANEKGALAGLATGMSFSMWMAFGGPKPPLPKLPVTNAGCTLASGYFNGTFANTCPQTPVYEPSDYFWLYRVTYLYNGLFGLIITISVGCLVSLLCRWLCRSEKENEELDPRLFIGPICRRLEQQQTKREMILSQIPIRDESEINGKGITYIL